MRAGDKPSITWTKGGDIRAVSLGADFCSEHEWGINPIQKAFGMTEGVGQDRREWKTVPTEFQWVTIDGAEGFAYSARFSTTDASSMIKNIYKGARRNNTSVFGAWDENGFVFLTSSPKEIKALRKFFEKVKNGGGCFIPARLLHEGEGLTIGLAPYFANEFEELAKEDKAKLEAKEAFEKTEACAKLKDLRLRASKAGIFLLYPAYMGASGSVFAKGKPSQPGERLYWLNDSRSDKPFGWMTDKELCKYIDDLEAEFLPKR